MEADRPPPSLTEGVGPSQASRPVQRAGWDPEWAGQDE